MIKRRRFIRHTALASTTAAVTACSTNSSPEVSADSLPNIRWRMVTSWPQALDTIYGGAQAICQRVSDATGGRFRITPYAAGEIVGGLDVLDAVQQGTAQCGHTASYYYVGKNPALGFGTAVPFGLTAPQQNAWLFQGGGLDIMNQLYADFNIIAFPAGNTGMQMGGWFRQEINSLSEMQGLIMRIPGLGGEVMSRLGVNVQAIAGGEIYVALERGIVDAAEFVGPYDDEKLGLPKVASLYYYPGWWEPGASLEVQVNRSAWEKLPREYQAVLIAATRESNSDMLARYEALNRDALQRLIDQGVQLKAFSPEILTAARDAAFELFEESASSDRTFGRVYQQWKAFRDRILQWHRLNQLPFAQFVSTQVSDSP